MAQKLKFRPVVTRVKLNPEQAVLFCACFTGLTQRNAGAGRSGTTFCIPRSGATKCPTTLTVRSTARNAATS